MLDDAKLDRLLDLDRGSEPSAALRARILDAAPRSRPRRLGWLAATGLGLALATSAMAGVAVGFKLAPPGVVKLVGSQVAPPDTSDAGYAAADPFDDDAA